MIGSEKRFCTFSRVTPEKGIDEAVKAIISANEKGAHCCLDIWGPIESEFEDHYQELFNKNNQYVCYRGILSQNDGLELLSEYYMLLFPTYYPGEGFPTTICEGFMAGLPVIASDWRFNTELIKTGETGFLFHVHNVEEMTGLIINAVNNEELIKTMKKKTVQYSHAFEPQNAMKNLLSWICGNRKQQGLTSKHKSIGIIGSFGYSSDSPMIGGQVSKTIGIYKELEKEHGKGQISIADTSNWKKEKVKLLINMFRIAKTCDPVLILPNQKGIKIILPVISILKKRNKYSIAYPVVGGWLPDCLKNNRYLVHYLNYVDYLLPETNILKNELKKYYNGEMDIMPIFSTRKPLESCKD
ncbi:MAG: glycosyltransferase [Clostridia bacterium]|nr:glycosyltransferase [Clostridia bacterium]